MNITIQPGNVKFLRVTNFTAKFFKIIPRRNKVCGLIAWSVHILHFVHVVHIVHVLHVVHAVHAVHVLHQKSCCTTFGTTHATSAGPRSHRFYGENLLEVKHQ